MKRTRLLGAVALVSLAASGPACSRRTTVEARPQPAAGALAGGSAVVATVDGLPITLAEVDHRAADRLASIRQEEYEARRAAAMEMVIDKLIEREAAARRVSPGDVLRVEVDAKAAPVKPEEVAAYYEENKERFAGRPRNEALAGLDRAMRKRNLDARRSAFQEELRSKAKIKVSLEAPRQDLGIPAGAPALGPATAAVTILEFADYQCPYCMRAEEAVTAILKDYQGKVRFVHRDFPLPNHDRAFVAARASRCAGEQGHFWDYRRSLLLAPGDFSDQDFQKRATGLGIDGKSFASCLQSERHDAAIKESQEEGVKAGVNATPTFFFNGRMQTGAPPIEEFRRIVEEELARKGA